MTVKKVPETYYVLADHFVREVSVDRQALNSKDLYVSAQYKQSKYFQRRDHVHSSPSNVIIQRLDEVERTGSRSSSARYVYFAYSSTIYYGTVLEEIPPGYYVKWNEYKLLVQAVFDTLHELGQYLLANVKTLND